MVGAVALTANRLSFMKPLGDDAARWISASPMFVLPYRFDRKALTSAVEHILQLNDGLRMRVSLDGGEITQVIGPPYNCLRIADFDIAAPSIDGADDLLRVKAYADAIRKEIDFTRDGFRLCVFPFKGHDRFGVVIISHHVLIDAVSVHAIMHQVRHHYLSFLERSVPGLANPGRYVDYVQSYYDACTSDYSAIDKWRAITPRLREHLGDVPEYESYAPDTAETYHTFPPEISRILLSDQQKGGKKDEVPRLLAAIGLAIREWNYKIPPILSLVFASRQGLPSAAKLHNTVGWISETVPVCLDKKVPHDASVEDIAQQLEMIRGVGRQYGFSRYLSDATENVEEFRDHSDPVISLNAKISPFRGLSSLGVESVPFGWDYNWMGRRAFPISGGLVLDEEGGLRLSWDYDVAWTGAPHVEELLERCVHCLLSRG